MLKTNYHTHTYFCDGQGTADEIVQQAINLGFNILGFSSHSMFPFGGDCHIAPREHQSYIAEVRKAAEKYKDKIAVLCGFEAEYIPGFVKPDFSVFKPLNPDFIIGSVHMIFTENGFFAVDYTLDELSENIKTTYKGDASKLVCEYFELERKMLQECNFTFIGHPDLIRKNNGKLHMFDENESWYRQEIKATADAIKKAGVIAEINTGAIARKKMDDVYPSREFLSLLYERAVPVMVNSDCHNPQQLDCAFDKAYDCALKAGYTEVAYLDEQAKIKFQKIS